MLSEGGRVVRMEAGEEVAETSDVDRLGLRVAYAGDAGFMFPW